MYFEALAAGAGGDWWHVVILQAPLGAAVNVTDGDEDIDTVGTGEPMAIPVHDENSTYDITVDATGFQWTAQFNTTSVSGGYEFIDIDYGTIHLTFDDEFRGLTLTVSDGGSNTGTFTAPATGNTVDVFVPALGTWTVSGTVSGKQYDSRPVTISDYAVAQSTKLILVPVGKTVLPTDDIETWLLCGEIKDKNYTTLDEVLADEATLIKLLTNDNAIDYMKRSTTWIVNEGLVPVLTGPTAAAFSDSVYASTSNYPWKAFDNQMASGWQGAATSFSSPQYVGYIFNNPIRIGRVMIEPAQWSTKSAAKDIEIQGSKDTTTGSDGTWVTLYTDTLPDTPNTEMYRILDVSDAYKAYRLVVKNSYEGTSAYIRELQFYPYKEAITESETAMSYIGAYDYAAEELLDDPVWNAGIMASEYWEKVLPGLVPTMTSNTTPCGSTFGTSDGFGSNYYRYYAFNSKVDKGWLNDSTAPCIHSGNYIGYEFVDPVILSRVGGISLYNGASTMNLAGKIEAYDDDTSQWVPVSNVFTITANVNNEQTFVDVNTSGKAYKKYRWYATANATSNSGYGLKLQFYGRATGSVQSWLCAAGIAKPYTTMDEVLADHETLAALMTNHNAVDYLVTAKNLILDIVGNERAMFYIGRRNYAADSLLADEEWAKAIANSEYWESVFNFSVPKMTSNTTPSGTASSSSNLDSSHIAFRAFDRFGSNSNAWHSAAGATQWIAYHFTKPVNIKAVSLLTYVTYGGPKVSKVQYSNNGGTTWLDYGNDPSFVDCLAADSLYTKLYNTDIYASDYRLYITDSNYVSSSNKYSLIADLQFYGREDVDETQILLRGAAGANIYKKVSGVDVPITTLVGTTDEVTKAQILGAGVDAGEVVIYSDVANDPDGLSNDYHKSVKVDDNTIDIDVMPYNSLYWYGYEHGIEDLSTANGWNWGATFVAPTHNTNSVVANVTTGMSMSGIGSKKKEKIIGYNIVSKGLYAASNIYGAYGSVVNKGDLANTFTDSYDITSANKEKHLVRGLIDERYVVSEVALGANARRSTETFAICLSKHNPAANFFSAANDTVYYVSGGAQVVFAETNDLGEAVVDFSKIPAGDYTLYSSVADDPDNLNQKYYKQITVEEDMRYRKIYLMPDGDVLYWYGYVGENFESAATFNGWVHSTFNSLGVPIYYEHLVHMNCNASGLFRGVGGRVSKGGIAKTISTNPYGSLVMTSGSTKVISDTTNYVFSSGTSLCKTELTNVNANDYITAFARYYNGTNLSNLNALWCERQ